MKIGDWMLESEKEIARLRAELAAKDAEIERLKRESALHTRGKPMPETDRAARAAERLVTAAIKDWSHAPDPDTYEEDRAAWVED